jgi:hypothetical protein
MTDQQITSSSSSSNDTTIQAEIHITFQETNTTNNNNGEEENDEVVVHWNTNPPPSSLSSTNNEQISMTPTILSTPLAIEPLRMTNNNNPNTTPPEKKKRHPFTHVLLELIDNAGTLLIYRQILDHYKIPFPQGLNEFCHSVLLITILVKIRDKIKSLVESLLETVSVNIINEQQQQGNIFFTYFVDLIKNLVMLHVSQPFDVLYANIAAGTSLNKENLLMNKQFFLRGYDLRVKMALFQSLSTSNLLFRAMMRGGVQMMLRSPDTAILFVAVVLATIIGGLDRTWFYWWSFLPAIDVMLLKERLNVPTTKTIEYIELKEKLTESIAHIRILPAALAIPLPLMKSVVEANTATWLSMTFLKGIWSHNIV